MADFYFLINRLYALDGNYLISFDAMENVEVE